MFPLATPPTIQLRARGFSLIELVVVLIILATVSAIAVPRMMRGAENADVIGVRANLNVLNRSLEMYRAEHGAYPPKDAISDLMLMYSNGAGNRVSATWTVDTPFGPYIVKAPVLTVGPNAGASKISATPADDVGWLYDDKTLQFLPNLVNGGTGTVAADLLEEFEIDAGDFGALGP